MALVVEDGTGLTNAESYVSVADADAYHASLGNAAWTGADAVKEVALRKATQYIDATYTFRGVLFRYNQSLRWPRWDVWYEGVLQNVWPVPRVKQACCELALRALAGELNVDQTDPAVTEETVGPITIKYAAPTTAGQPQFPLVDNLLAPFVAGGPGTIRIERA